MDLRTQRGKTVKPIENVLITNMVMHTASGHFNEHEMQDSPFGSLLAFGGVNFSLILGLSAQDCCENALAELGLDKIRLSKPVKHGDTLYAYSEVLETGESPQEDAGIVRFLHYGFNQRDEQVLQLERTALLKRRSHWANR